MLKSVTFGGTLTKIRPTTVATLRPDHDLNSTASPYKKDALSNASIIIMSMGIASLTIDDLGGIGLYCRCKITSRRD